MRYLSTRGQSAHLPFSSILLAGLAPDSGLYLPENYPKISEDTLADWRKLSYPDLAFAIMSCFIDDIPASDLKAIIDKTYTPENYCHSRNGCDAAEITPLIPLEDGLFLQELSNGPTLAFKDVAMQFLGNLFEYTLDKKGKSLNILGATSGDTGSAAEYALRGKRHIKVFMLSPEGKMSAFQRAQMYSLTDKNIFNIAVRGMFDDAQDIVKSVFSDAAFKEKYKIGAVNSINWARVLAQTVYYFYGYFRATTKNDERVSFCVPTGNFGNIYAGHLAKQMGLPIRRLLLATNENDVLDEFFRQGIYRPRKPKETFVTSSPSMDISKASNFERFIFDFVGRDKTVIRDLWKKVERGESFDLTGTVYWQKRDQFGFVSGRSTHADRLQNIRHAYEKYGRIIDPHTADAMHLALTQRKTGESLVVLETAQAAKFEEIIQVALGISPPRPALMEGIEKQPQHVVVCDVNAEEIKKFIMEKAE